jgi:hypothetical protein
MTTGSTPGPGGFGPSPAFGGAHPGITLVPAQTRPQPGVFNAASTGMSFWFWILLLVAAVVAVAVAAFGPPT